MIWSLSTRQGPIQFLMFVLLYFLLKRVKLRRGEELTQSNIQTVAYHFYREKLWILAFPVQNILDA